MRLCRPLPRRPAPLLFALLPTALVFAAACGPDATGPLPACPAERLAFRPDLPSSGDAPSDWLAYPFPSDHRRTPWGTAELIDLPNPGGADLLDAYIAAGEAQLNGFGLASPTYFKFEAPLTLAALSHDPGAALEASSPLLIVDIDPSSPERLQRVPLRWQWRGEGDRFRPDNTLALAPAWGFPLRPGTTYAALVLSHAATPALVAPPLLSALLDSPAQCGREASPEAALYEQFSPLRAALAELELDPAQVAAATVFTTHRATEDLDQIAADLEAAPPPAYDDAGWQALGPGGAPFVQRSAPTSTTTTTSYWLMEGRYEAPNYQEGAVPYASAGGAIHLEGGRPAPTRQERLRFVLSLPTTPPQGGPCYPIVLYSHGTGGSAYTFAGRTAARLAARGLAAISVDQPLHGPRAEGQSFELELMSFNVLNPDSALGNFRQGAIDIFSLRRFAEGALKVPAARSPTGQDICFDPARIGFFGHSQGAITGSIASGAERKIGAWLYSGGGGGLALAVIHRKDPFDLADILSTVIDLAPTDAPLDDFHPAIALFQTLADLTDPATYMRQARQGEAHRLITSGLLDVQTPWQTASVLGLAAQAPVTLPLGARAFPGQALLSPATQSAPVRPAAGQPLRAFTQWSTGDHFVVFQTPEAIHASTRFLESALVDGAPELILDPQSPAR